MIGLPYSEFPPNPDIIFNLENQEKSLFLISGDSKDIGTILAVNKSALKMTNYL